MPVAISRWQHPPKFLSLPSGQAHLWRFRLDLPASDVASLRGCLSADESVRAERLIIPEKKQQFVVARAILRDILSRYLEKQPFAIKFRYGQHGKPSLLDTDNLHFNLAHSADWALLAVTRSGDVGVDIEQLDAALDYVKLAERYFDAQDLAALKSTVAPRRRRAFFRLWTRKESLLKRSGRGFFAVSNTQSSDPSVQFRLLPVSREYLGALACSLEITSINRYQYLEKQ